MSNNILAMINFARTGNAVDFNKSFQSEMRERVGDAIQTRRIDVVSNMFGVQPQQRSAE